MSGDTRARWLYVMVALVVVIVLGAQFARAWEDNPAHEMQGITQERLDRAPAPLDELGGLSQTFLCERNGLHAIELLLVVYDTTTPLPEHGLLTLSMVGDDGSGPILSSVPTSGLEHNQRVRFELYPQERSKGVRYTMTLRAVDCPGVTFWTCAQDAYSGGRASSDNGAVVGGDLYFVTFGNYALREAAADAVCGLADWLSLWPAALALLVAPGLAIWAWLWPRRWRRGAVSLTMALALSLVSWPLLLLWTSTLGLSMGQPGIHLFGSLWLLLALIGLWRRRTVWGPIPPWRGLTRQALPDLVLFLVLLIAFATRWWHTRELIVPAWVDSHHHTLITKMIVDLGRVPLDWRPYADMSDFHYHYGFHANAAALSWLSGLPVSDAVLILGQWLNALAALVTAGLATAWTRRISGGRWAAPVAALIVALVAFMPAYYVSWGRYTQLTGLVVLPGLLLAADGMFQPGAGRRARLGMALTTAILLAGMGVTHYRVLVFVALWAPLAAILAWARHGTLRSTLRELAPATLALVGATALLILPWIWRFASLVLPHVGANYGGMAASPGVDVAFPVGLLDVGNTRKLVTVAAVGAGWALLRGRWQLALLAPWAGLCFLVANAHVLGLANLWLISNACVFISFWLPVGALVGWLAADLFGLLVGGLRLVLRSVGDPSPLLGWVALAALLWVGGKQAWGTVNVVNPTTELVTEEDMAAIAWCRDNLPDDALVLINTRKWQGELRCGTDGGWWLPILADTQVTLPPVMYGQGGPAYVAEINGFAGAVEDAESLDDPVFLAMLRERGVTHVYSGPKGGRLMPADLDPSPAYEVVFSHGAARVYALH